MDRIDDLRFELQRAGEILLESLRPEFQELRKAIVNDIEMELQKSRRRKFRQRSDPRKQAIAKMIQDTPGMRTLHICHEMDKLQEKSAAYAPPHSWPRRLWWESYRQASNRVHSYVSSIRRSLR